MNNCLQKKCRYSSKNTNYKTQNENKIALLNMGLAPMKHFGIPKFIDHNLIINYNIDIKMPGSSQQGHIHFLHSCKLNEFGAKSTLYLVNH